MMSVDSPEFNRFTNDHILREWDAIYAAHAGRLPSASKESQDPEARAIAWERSTARKIGSLQGLAQAVSRAFANRVAIANTGYAPVSLSSTASVDADRT
ncbi:hypothetical protein G6L46_30565 [Agrobacterium rhizogenes]|uniref:hypothetical protein n=1 Tax=Rhizobium rhizogenes TaxID=359 RepID=UPI001573D2A2|nr:hypothetical protein [Rhizobium rhizogenes]NTF91513.1 hypothetical protein [Rhizobium rhizogenes]